MEKSKYIYGNWKMNGLLGHMELAKAVEAGAKEIGAQNVEVGICPPFTLLKTIKDGINSIVVGAQDCHFTESGAHTGDISAIMLKEIGVGAVILGHSERRTNHFETSDLVAKKAIFAQQSGLKTIVCVGESLQEREAGNAETVVLKQIIESALPELEAAKLIIAYEPVWAIGTGKVASNDDIREMHLSIRNKLIEIFGDSGKDIPIQYGGSVNAKNASEILAIENVNGALVGGASLKAPDFLEIIKAAATL